MDKLTENMKSVEMVRYIESELEITKKAIENFKSDPEKIKRHQNRLKRACGIKREDQISKLYSTPLFFFF